jgi:predicted nucleic acid-binding protein
MRVYLDVCCLNRPFDDQTQERIRLESEAILLILQHFQSDEWQFISSEIVIDEIEQTPNNARRTRLHQLLTFVDEVTQVNESVVERAEELMKFTITAEDALHLACAEYARVSVFLTTDDRLLRRAAVVEPPLACRVDNPLSWLLEQRK